MYHKSSSLGHKLKFAYRRFVGTGAGVVGGEAGDVITLCKAATFS